MKNGHTKLANADYSGCNVRRWPPIGADDLPLFVRLLETCRTASWVSAKERAAWHRYLVYSFAGQ